MISIADMTSSKLICSDRYVLLYSSHHTHSTVFISLSRFLKETSTPSWLLSWPPDRTMHHQVLTLPQHHCHYSIYAYRILFSHPRLSLWLNISPRCPPHPCRPLFSPSLHLSIIQNLIYTCSHPIITIVDIISFKPICSDRHVLLYSSHHTHSTVFISLSRFLDSHTTPSWLHSWLPDPTMHPLVLTLTQHHYH